MGCKEAAGMGMRPHPGHETWSKSGISLSLSVSHLENGSLNNPFPNGFMECCISCEFHLCTFERG